MTFSLDFGRGGIGIFGSRKSGSKCGESSPVDIRCAAFNGGIQYASPNIIGEKVVVAQAVFHRYCSTSQPLPKLLTPSPNVI